MSETEPDIHHAIINELPPDGIVTMLYHGGEHSATSKWRIFWYEQIPDGSFAVKLQRVSEWVTAVIDKVQDE